MTCHTLVVTEAGREGSGRGRSYSVRELMERADPPIRDQGLLLRAFQAMRVDVETHMAMFRRRSSRIYGYPLTIDSPPPRILRRSSGFVVYPGLWVGVYEYHEGGECVRILVNPCLENYHLLVRDAARLEPLEPLMPLVGLSAASAPSFSLIEAAMRLAAEVLKAAEEEPMRLPVLEESTSGGLLVLEGPGPKLYNVSSRLNIELLSALAAAVNNLAGLAAAIEGEAELVKQYASRGLGMLVDDVVRGLRERLAALLSSPAIEEALRLEELAWPGKYSYLVEASKRILEASAAGRGGWSRHLLYPSPKLYELYVYAKLIEQLQRRGCTAGHTTHPLAVEIHCGQRRLMLYFNHYPASHSRLIARLTGRPPRPDIVAADARTSILEAKYRFIDGVKLGVADAVRLAAYILDAARDTVLAALIAALDRPEDNVVEASIDGKEILVSIARVNPDMGVEDIAEPTLNGTL